jgi:hypothetical protein
MEKGFMVVAPVLMAAEAALVGGMAALVGVMVVVGVAKDPLELTRRALVCGGGVCGSAPRASSAAWPAKDSKKDGF